MSTAAASPTYRAAIEALGPDVNVSYNSVFDLWHVNPVSCVKQLESVNIAYSLQTPLGTEQLTVAENPTLTSVENITFELLAPGPISGATYYWTGWEMGPSSGSSLTGTFAQWQYFSASAPSGYCGASTYGIGWCEMGFWSGLTAVSGGSTGIAQSGIDAWVECQWEGLLGYICGTTYNAWYEFYPQMQTESVCFSFTSGNDQVYSEISWEAPNTYWAQIWDVTSGQYCSPGPETTMAMDTPHYAEFQGENANSPTGGYYPTPHFNFWFNPSVARGLNLNLNADSPYPWKEVGGVSLSSIYYNTAPCPSGESCFEESDS